MENACLNRKAFGYEFDGGFSQYLKVPAVFIESENIFTFSNEITFEEACLAEPLGCVVNGSERCNIALGDAIVILGAGPIGLMHTLLAKFKGAGKVIVSEPLESRRNLAKILGADIVVNPAEENLQEVVFRETGELGADVAILSVGLSTLVMPAMKLLKRGGILNLFGGFPKGETALIDPNLVHYEEVWITGATACKRSHYEKALRLISEKKIDLKPLISNRFELGDFKQALQTAKAGAGIKIIVKPN
jgi:L-iditol 2-dehydrogenase